SNRVRKASRSPARAASTSSRSSTAPEAVPGAACGARLFTGSTLSHPRYAAGSSVDPLSSSADLRAFLGRVRVLLRRHDAVRWLGWTLAALTAVALAMPLGGLALVGPRQAAFAIVAAGGMIAILVLIGGVVLGAIAPHRRWRSDAAVARWVGKREPAIASDLL